MKLFLYQLFCGFFGDPPSYSETLSCVFVLDIMHSLWLVAYMSPSSVSGHWVVPPPFFFFFSSFLLKFVYLSRQPFSSFRQDLRPFQLGSLFTAHSWYRREIHIFSVSANSVSGTCLRQQLLSLSLYCENG